jgi:hypothetical protein
MIYEAFSEFGAIILLPLYKIVLGLEDSLYFLNDNVVSFFFPVFDRRRAKLLNFWTSANRINGWSEKPPIILR